MRRREGCSDFPAFRLKRRSRARFFLVFGQPRRVELDVYKRQDVTGSMGMIADALARKGLGTMVEEILARKPVSDPHIMCMGIGDVLYDRAPLQVTQFEADIRIAEQLEKLWLRCV